MNLSTDAVRRLGLHARPAGTIVFPKRGEPLERTRKRLLAAPSAYDLNTLGVVPVAEAARYLRTWFEQLNLGALVDGSNVPQTDNKDIAQLQVPLPPSAEMDLIRKESAKRVTEPDASWRIVQANVRRSERLRQSILKRAFEGKPVDQDPDDEPASVLLERIRAEREAATSGSGTHKKKKASTKGESAPSKRQRKKVAGAW